MKEKRKKDILAVRFLGREMQRGCVRDERGTDRVARAHRRAGWVKCLDVPHRGGCARRIWDDDLEFALETSVMLGSAAIVQVRDCAV
jgi:hypothetical protein